MHNSNNNSGGQVAQMVEQFSLSKKVDLLSLDSEMKIISTPEERNRIFVRLHAKNEVLTCFLNQLLLYCLQDDR